MHVLSDCSVLHPNTQQHQSVVQYLAAHLQFTVHTACMSHTHEMLIGVALALTVLCRKEAQQNQPCQLMR